MESLAKAAAPIQQLTREGSGHEAEEDASIKLLLGVMKLARDTKRNYVWRIKEYLRYIGKTPDTFVEETRADPKTFERQFIAFLQMRSQTISPSTLMMFPESMKKFLEISRVSGVEWVYIGQFVPRGRNKSGQDRAPTAEEVRRLVDRGDLRLKCLILFLCTSGARIGSVAYLRWRDVEEVEVNGSEKFAKVTIYRGEPEQYVSFITPECYRYLLEYRRTRESLGESVTTSSFVFVSLPNKRRPDPSTIRPIRVTTWKNLLMEHQSAVGGRSIISERNGGRHNYEYKQAHGFRKFFKTRMEVAGVRPIIVETLMGHSIGISKSYFKPTDAELAEGYSHGIEGLTIVDSKRGVDQNTMIATFNRQFLKMSKWTDEEIEALGDLGAIPNEKLIELIDKKNMERIGLNNGNHQKVIMLKDLEKYIDEGWEYVTTFNTDKAIVRLLPSSSSSR